MTFRGNLRALLEGCSPQIFAMIALSLGSVFLDLVCMSLLPLFVMVALGAKDLSTLSVPFADSWLAALSLTGFTIFIVCLFFSRAFYMLLLGASMAALTESVRKQVVGRLFESILWRAYEVAIAQPVASGITTITGYTNGFAQQVVLPLMRMLADILTIFAVLAFLAVVEPVVVVLVVGVLATVGGGYYLGIRRINDHQSHRLADLEIHLTQQATQALSAPREIRIFGVQEQIEKQAVGTLSALASVRAWLGAIYWFPRALGELTLIGLAIAYMVIKTHTGADFATVASNLSFIAFAGLRVLPAFAQCMANISQVRSGRTISARLVDMLSQGRRLQPTVYFGEANAVAGKRQRFESLSIHDLSFGYAGSNDLVFDKLSMDIKAGESIGIVGASGAGKSTLGDLLLGLLAPKKGEVQVNGTYCSLTGPDWWQFVGFVPQSPFILNDSLLHNVAFGLPDGLIDKHRVEQCLDMARLSEVVAGLPKGTDTIIGDFGVRLSGGQRQRVAIARTLYWQRDFLVLDEATSALDAATEAEVIKSIEALKGKVTTVVIAHRYSTLANCDRVYEVRDGALHLLGSGMDLVNQAG